jgi:cell wall assembly regulator SMI1
MYRESPMMCAHEVPSEREVQQASASLGISFPEDYREFVLRYGGGMAGPYPIFGLRPVDIMDSDRWSVIEITEETQETLVETTHWVIFSEDHSGNPIGFDRSGRVWIFDHDFGGATEVARDFESYLRQQCLKLSD